MFKKVQKKSTGRVRDAQEEDNLSLPQNQNQNMQNIQEDVDMIDESATLNTKFQKLSQKFKDLGDHDSDHEPKQVITFKKKQIQQDDNIAIEETFYQEQNFQAFSKINQELIDEEMSNDSQDSNQIKKVQQTSSNSRFPVNKRRGLVHQKIGSNQSSNSFIQDTIEQEKKLSASQFKQRNFKIQDDDEMPPVLSDNDEIAQQDNFDQYSTQTNKKRLVPSYLKDSLDQKNQNQNNSDEVDLEMIYEGAALEEEDVGDLEGVDSEQLEQIRRLKELKHQKKMQQNSMECQDSDFIRFNKKPGQLIDSQKTDFQDKSTFEAQLLKRQLIRDQYESARDQMKVEFDRSRQRQGKMLFDLDDSTTNQPLSNGLNQDDLASQEGTDQEEKEEIEALIKKRVKEGSGRDYEHIIKKDVQYYQKAKGAQLDSEIDEISKYENSIGYKKVQNMMEADITEIFSQIDLDQQYLDKQIAQNKINLEKTRQQQQASSTQIQEADQQFAQTGDDFIKAKELCEILEDLKEMLTEKEVDIESLIQQKQAIELQLHKSLQHEYMGHISDIFREGGVQQSPFFVNKHFSLEVQREIIESAPEQRHRNEIRENLILSQNNSQQNLWDYLHSQIILNDPKLSSEIQSISQELIFGDTIEQYQNLEFSFYPCLDIMIKLGITPKMDDVLPFIIPYLKVELLSTRNEQLYTGEFLLRQFKNLKLLQSFFVQHSDKYSQVSQQIFISKLLTETLHPKILSFIHHTQWCPLNLPQTQSFSAFIKSYVDLIYIQPSDDLTSIFGLTQVKELLDAILNRYKDFEDLLQLPKSLGLQSFEAKLIIDGLRVLSQSILLWQGQIPDINIQNFLFGNILNDKILNLVLQQQQLYDKTVIEEVLKSIINEKIVNYQKESANQMSQESMSDQKESEEFCKSQIFKFGVLIGRIQNDLQIQIIS
eukprot:403367867